MDRSGDPGSDRRTVRAAGSERKPGGSAGRRDVRGPQAARGSETGLRGRASRDEGGHRAGRTDTRSSSAGERPTGGRNGDTRAGRGRADQPRSRGEVRTPRDRGTPAAAVYFPPDATLDQLDRGTQNELRALDEFQRPFVAGHLVMAVRLLEEDPDTAYAHAALAARKAPRLAVVREAAGLAAYAAGLWEQAIRDLKAAMRISGSVEFLPIVADCERGLHRPQRAIALAGSAESQRLNRAGQVEMRIVAAGARADMGDIAAAELTLRSRELSDSALHPWSISLWYAYADILQQLGRLDDAIEWFAKAADVDEDDSTDAAERLAALIEQVDEQ